MDFNLDLDDTFLEENDLSPNVNGLNFKAFSVNRVQLGTMMAERTFSSEWDSQDRSTFQFYDDFSTAKLSVDFKNANLTLFFFEGSRLHKAQIAFSQLSSKIQVGETSVTTLTIASSYNPLLWVAKDGAVRSGLKHPFIIKDWVRTTHISNTDLTHLGQPCSLLMRRPNLPMENWPVWHLELSKKNVSDSNFQFQKAMEALVNYKKATRFQRQTIATIANSSKSDCSIGLPYDITFTRLYYVECLISNNLINRFQLNSCFFKLIQTPPRHILERVIERLWSKKQFIKDPLTTFQQEIDNATSIPKQKANLNTHALVRKVLITPTKFYILPPVLEESNRVLREYKHHHDRFLRVTFCDETMTPIHSNFAMNYKLLKRVQDVLFFGIHLARRQYQFLAFSSSQLKGHSCWFVSDKDDFKADSIRAWMGDFSDIRIVAKHAARMGQCFSSSRDGAEIGLSNIKLIRDYKYKTHLFTDGVGMISEKKMELIARQLEITTFPSAIQFRMGGFKGVLSSWPQLPELPILVRGSQEKFSSKHATLEVLRVATYNAGHLNRQIIMLLSSLGVPDSVFHELQSEMLSNIRHIMTNPKSAISTLSSFSDEFGTSRELIKLIQAGFYSSTDHFVKNCLSLNYISANNMLKKRARIQVPKGALLMGIADETRMLGPNEIFLQYNDPSSSKNIIRPTGKCLVTRNPCFHPGDIRIVTAVDVPELHHLVNCVVFSTKGTQSVPSMCSGGDLDGDDFTVIWDERLIPQITNLEPMKHLPATPIEVDSVHIDDIKKFFGNYIMNDNLGQIANTHLVLADLSPQGAQDPRCLQLAQLHSRAVDFTKTGIPAELPKDLLIEKYPDFMGRSQKRSYKSTKILGQLFRSMHYERHRPAKASKPDASLLVRGYKSYLEEAYAVKYEYNATLRSLMDQYGIDNELEVVTGCISKYRELVCKRAYETRRIICQAYHMIKLDFIRKFNDEFKDSTLDKPVLSKKMRCKASAWYYAAYNPSDMEPRPALKSFGWIAKDHLIPIKLKATYGQLDRIKPDHIAYELASTILRHESIPLPQANMSKLC